MIGEPHPCPACNAAGHLRGFACPGFRPVDIACNLCRGSGHLSDEALARWTRGREMREDRIRRDMSLREEAKRRGMTARELSDLERGIAAGREPAT